MHLVLSCMVAIVFALALGSFTECPPCTLADMRSWLRNALPPNMGAWRSSGASSGPHRATKHAYHAVESALDVGPREKLKRYYSLDASQLPGAARVAYRPLETDNETNEFLMFVASKPHYADLLSSALDDARQALVGADDTRSHGLSLLDVGAGDGDVTARLAPLFDNITVTEVSVPMARRLTARGYTTHITPFLTPQAFPEPGGFDVVSIHNVLDRCDHPRDLLRGAIRLMRPGTGRLLLAVVLPFCEFVEDGTTRRPANGPLPMSGARCQDGASFEASLSALITRVLWPLGLQVERIAKLPYLCRGDMLKPYYVLADAILVCRHVGEEARDVEQNLPGETRAQAGAAAQGPSKKRVPLALGTGLPFTGKELSGDSLDSSPQAVAASDRLDT